MLRVHSVEIIHYEEGPGLEHARTPALTRSATDRVRIGDYDYAA